ncbi:hypothetical protein [Methanococcus voltae]|uniref:Uncharacterized protein n=1 Tax=Methanococcus voltae (strain ATCC BAA-1334 / A3) TaxID=456320 RepID=D7DSG3_METV3|nr:hypothetical protein [Methanococcus voltae]MCS3901599.1 hypothetical protein [Methanococcus voltae]
MYLKSLINYAISTKTFDIQEFFKLGAEIGINLKNYNFNLTTKTKSKTKSKYFKEVFRKIFKEFFDDFVEKIKNMDIITRCKYLLNLNTITPKQAEILKKMKKNYLSTVLVGKGGGKDFMTSLLFNDELIDLILTDIPYTRVDFINIAPNADLAHNVFFREFKQWFSRCKLWKLFKNSEKSPIKINNTFIKIGDLVKITSGHSRSASFEGTNPKCIVIDEISDENFMNAEKIFYQAKSSVQTRWGKDGKVILISWTRFPTPNPLDDIGYKIYSENLGIDDVFSFKGATWEVNSHRSKFDFEDDYKRNGVLAKKMYECKPPELSNYFINADKLKNCQVNNLNSKINQQITQQITQKNNQKNNQKCTSIFSWNPIYDDTEGKVKLDFKRLNNDIIKNNDLYVHFDLSIKHDSTGIALSYYDKEHKTVNVANIIELKPTNNHIVDYNSLETFITYLKNNFSLKLSFDQFNSQAFIQKFGGKRISKNIENWKVFQQLVENNELLINCREDIWEKLFLQIIQHQINENKVIYYGKNSPDLADCVIPSVYNCYMSNSKYIPSEVLDEIFDDAKHSDSYEITIL